MSTACPCGCRLRISPLGVKDTVLLEDFGDNGDCRVHRVRDDEDEGLWGVLRDAGGEVAHNACVDLAER